MNPRLFFPHCGKTVVYDMIVYHFFIETVFMSSLLPHAFFEIIFFVFRIVGLYSFESC